jgi:hypothetical protein
MTDAPVEYDTAVMGFVRRFVGPSREEIWRRLSQELNGRYVDGGWWRGDKVEVDHEDWTFTLDTYAVSTGKVTVVYTRMRAPFVNPTGFRFTVYRASIFSTLGTLLGMQDVEIGDAPFDRDFVIKANDETRVRTLLSNARLRALIAAQPDVKFSVEDDEGWFGSRFPDGVDKLEFVVTGVVKNIDRLKQVYELLAEALDELCRIGAASDSPVKVELR